jgi:hypothetical protein
MLPGNDVRLLSKLVGRLDTLARPCYAGARQLPAGWGAVKLHSGSSRSPTNLITK